ncbi:MAG: extracellular solute-binding protein [Selenomonadaceae bacterium]|nr:extracellular solute-binding protein [Selenomonadaceae bacterium]
MRRYTSLLLTAFALFLIVLCGSAYLAGADETKHQRPMREMVAYTTLPAAHVELLTEEYEKLSRIRVNFVPLSQEDLLTRLKAQEVESRPEDAAVVLADRETLRTAAAEGCFTPYVSEAGDAAAEAFKDPDGLWTGVWYDPMVFCVNRDYLKHQQVITDTWVGLSALTDARIGITDFMAADASANLLFSMISQYGDAAAYQIWRQIHPHVVQYAKYLNNPVRQAGMGEVDISVAVQSETLRYLNDGYPVKIIYPADGTSYMLTGTGIVKSAQAEDIAAAQDFADWLLTDDAQQLLQRNGFYFMPTNPATLAYKSFPGKNLVLYDHLEDFTPEQRHDFLDRWVKYIRLQ